MNERSVWQLGGGVGVVAWVLWLGGCCGVGRGAAGFEAVEWPGDGEVLRWPGVSDGGPGLVMQEATAVSPEGRADSGGTGGRGAVKARASCLDCGWGGYCRARRWAALRVARLGKLF